MVRFLLKITTLVFSLFTCKSHILQKSLKLLIDSWRPLWESASRTKSSANSSSWAFRLARVILPEELVARCDSRSLMYKLYIYSQAHSDMDPESGEEVTASDVIVELSHVLFDKARSFASRRGITSRSRPISSTRFAPYRTERSRVRSPSPRVNGPT